MILQSVQAGHWQHLRLLPWHPCYRLQLFPPPRGRVQADVQHPKTEEALHIRTYQAAHRVLTSFLFRLKSPNNRDTSRLDVAATEV